MALKKTFQTKMGVSGEYINFHPSITDKTTVVLRMKYWKDETTRLTDGAIPFNDEMTGSSSNRITGFNCLYTFTYDLDSVENVYQQGYDYLKTLSEFDGIEDVITDEQSTQLSSVKAINIKKIS